MVPSSWVGCRRIADCASPYVGKRSSPLIAMGEFVGHICARECSSCGLNSDRTETGQMGKAGACLGCSRVIETAPPPGLSTKQSNPQNSMLNSARLTERYKGIGGYVCWLIATRGGRRKLSSLPEACKGATSDSALRWVKRFIRPEPKFHSAVKRTAA